MLLFYFFFIFLPPMFFMQFIQENLHKNKETKQVDNTLEKKKTNQQNLYQKVSFFLNIFPEKFWSREKKKNKLGLSWAKLKSSRK